MALGSVSTACSHLSTAQKATAVKKELMAYTSPSTAENQKLSENVYANAPTAPAPSTAMTPALSRFSLPPNSFAESAVMVQKRNKMLNELESALNAFTIKAWFSGEPANWPKRLPINWKKGAPGG